MLGGIWHVITTPWVWDGAAKRIYLTPRRAESRYALERIERILEGSIVGVKIGSGVPMAWYRRARDPLWTAILGGLGFRRQVFVGNGKRHVVNSYRGTDARRYRQCGSWQGVEACTSVWQGSQYVGWYL